MTPPTYRCCLILLMVCALTAPVAASEWVITGPAGGAARELVADPSLGGTVFALTLHGVASSDDGGQTWRRTHPQRWYRLSHLTVDETHGALFVCAPPGWGGHSLYRSLDAGVSWTPVRDDVFGVQPYENGARRGILVWTRDTLDVSLDGGDSWERLVADAAAELGFSILAVEAVRGGGGALYLAGDGTTDPTLLASRDGGRTWSPPTTLPGRVYRLAAGTGVSASTVDGRGWQALAPHPDVTGGVDLEISPDGRTLYLAVAHGGVAVLELGAPRPVGGRLR